MTPAHGFTVYITLCFPIWLTNWNSDFLHMEFDTCEELFHLIEPAITMKLQKMWYERYMCLLLSDKSCHLVLCPYMSLCRLPFISIQVNKTIFM